MKKILLPTNFSKKSDDVIAFALEAFKDEACVFYFIHTYPYEIYGLDAINLLHSGNEFFEKANLKAITKMVIQVSYFALKEENSKHHFKLLCKNAELIDAVNEAVEKFEIDIVLIGTEGENKKTKRYKEKTVNKLINEVKTCPVMAVPLNGVAWESLGLMDIKLAS